MSLLGRFSQYYEEWRGRGDIGGGGGGGGEGCWFPM